MEDSPFAFSFEKKPKPDQWENLKKVVPKEYSLPDHEMIAQLHRSKIPIPIMNINEWFDFPDNVRNQDEEELYNLIGKRIPEGYKIPDMMRFKNIFDK